MINELLVSLLHIGIIKYSSLLFDKIDLPFITPIESTMVAPLSFDAKFFLFFKTFIFC